MALRWLRAAYFVATAMLLILLWILSNYGLGLLPVISLAVGMRRLITAAALGVLALITLVALIAGVRGAGHRLGLRRAWLFGATAFGAIVCSVAIVISGSTLQRAGSVPTAAAQTSLRILSWNTNQQDVSASKIENLISETKPDVVVLPEYFVDIGKSKLGTFADAHGFSILGWQDGSASTLLIKSSLGMYKVSHDNPAWAGFLASPESSSSNSPSILVAHLQRPSITQVGVWREHLAWVANQCHQANLVAIGDFNATVGNLGASSIAGCRDAASSLGVQAGTWPSALPAALGAQIDHVMAGSRWRAKYFSVLAGFDDAGSDHRPIFAILTKSKSSE